MGNSSKNCTVCRGHFVVFDFSLRYQYQLSYAIQFSIFSSYKMSYGKSEVMPLGGFNNLISLTRCPLKLSVTGFIYLSVSKSVTKLEGIVETQLCPVIVTTKRDLELWNDLPMSFTGCINLIKMNVFPRLLSGMAINLGKQSKPV